MRHSSKKPCRTLRERICKLENVLSPSFISNIHKALPKIQETDNEIAVEQKPRPV
jgi:hypothetical protein